MMRLVPGVRRHGFRFILVPVFCALSVSSLEANPVNGTVTKGSASFTSAGSQFTIQTSDRAAINWQSFNIGVGETTTFIQPSASSVVWNSINDPNPSQILGTLNANGYVVLQNSSGFYIGGSAVIAAHGLLMTTAPIPVPDLSSSGPWTFNALPPTARIINYGQINVGQGGSMFLIAHDIENHGSISAPGGNIGLYAGKEVLVSARPDGRGLSARVTLPEGSVNNDGMLIADAGTIAVHAQVVNQGGLVQANSVRQLNGVIELVASDSLNLSDTSVLSAKGDTSAGSASPGGMITLKAGNSYADTTASTISLAGANGGRSGILELLNNGADSSSIHSVIDDYFALLINPYDITISGGLTDTSSSNPNFSISDLTKYSHINLEALDNIEIVSRLTLANRADGEGTLGLSAGNNIILDNGSGITAGLNWNVSLTAGTLLTSSSDRQAGNDGIYLLGNAFIQTQNRDIDLWAGNEVLVNAGESGDVGNNGIRTLAGGSITVRTVFGDVNSGANTKGFRTPYRAVAPYYTVLTTLGGISTAAGGNVTIDAGGDVISFLPSGTDPSVASDAGSGAFGPQPGDVHITAGGNVYGHFIVANGNGAIVAGQNAGGADASQNLALSLIKGSWSVNASENIYLQEVRNPNGDLNYSGNGANHIFDYDLQDSVELNAGVGVYLTGLNVPRPDAATVGAIPMVFPPSLQISAGSGGITLQDSVSLFPSPYGNLRLTTTGGGDLTTSPNNPQLNPTPALIMSDSAETRYIDSDTFGLRDHSAVLTDFLNADPATFDIDGSIRNIILMTTKQTRINVAGNMEGCSFSGENRSAGDVTSINVAGQIFNRSPYTFYSLNQNVPAVPAGDLPPTRRNTWDAIFGLAMDPDKLAALHVPANQTPAQLANLLSTASLFLTRPGFFLDPKTQTLGFNGPMSEFMRTALENPLTVVRYGADGLPMVDASGHFVTETISWGVPVAAIESLYSASQGAPNVGDPAGLGYEVGGPGQFIVRAGSISLGNTYGILTTGVGDLQGNHRFASLTHVTPSGADLSVTVDGTLDMSASTIASLGGGNVTVNSTGGGLNLGSEELAALQQDIIRAHGIALGIYSSGSGDVTVTALKDIDVNTSRIATYNGGSISVKSFEGNVNAGNGDVILTPVKTYFVGANGAPGEFDQSVFGSGILATTLSDPSRVPGSPALPGNILVETPQGNIVANQGGILQAVLNGKLLPGPTVTLIAGTRPTDNSAGFVGNIALGNSGVIGGTVNLDANGDITGLVISRQNSTINAAQSFSGTVLSGGTANLSAGGNISGTIIGIGGVTASGGAGVTATVLGQNVSINGGQAESTLGTTATATSVGQAASQQANTEAKQQVATTDQQDDDKKKTKRPVITRRSRVTVILPKST